jgi:hypothetical protein
MKGIPKEIKVKVYWSIYEIEGKVLDYESMRDEFNVKMDSLDELFRNLKEKNG